MSKSFTVVPVPLVPPDGKHELMLDLRDPGVVLSVGFVLKRREVNLDIESAMSAMARGRKPKEEYDEVLHMFVQSTRGAPMRARRFMILGSLLEIAVPDGLEARFIGTAHSPHTQAIAHVFELVREVVDVMGVRTPKFSAVKKEIGPPADEPAPEPIANEAAS